MRARVWGGRQLIKRSKINVWMSVENLQWKSIISRGTVNLIYSDKGSIKAIFDGLIFGGNNRPPDRLFVRFSVRLTVLNCS